MKQSLWRNTFYIYCSPPVIRELTIIGQIKITIKSSYLIFGYKSMTCRHQYALFLGAGSVLQPPSISACFGGFLLSVWSQISIPLPFKDVPRFSSLMTEWKQQQQTPNANVTPRINSRPFAELFYAQRNDEMRHMLKEQLSRQSNGYSRLFKW